MTESTTVNPLAIAVSQILGARNELARSANQIVTQINAVTNVGKLVFEIRDTSDDQNVVDYRAFIADLEDQMSKAEATIEAYIKSALLPKSDETIDIDALKATHKELVAKANALTQSMATLGGAAEGDEVIPINTLSGRKSSTSESQTAQWRPRVELITVASVSNTEAKVQASIGKTQSDGTVTYTHNFSAAIAFLNKEYKGNGLTVQDLQDAAKAEAKTSDLNSLQGKPFSFVISLKDKDSTNLMVEVTPTFKG
jgi:hypothetical protein